MKTIVSLLEERVNDSPNALALSYRGERTWESISWATWWERSERLAAYLIHEGLKPGDRVLVLSRTRIEWLIADIGIMMAGGASVPVFPSLLSDACIEIAEDAGVSFLILEDRAQAEKLKDLDVSIPRIVFELDSSSTTLSAVEMRGQGILSEHPEIVSSRRRRLSISDLASIVYTSGTSRRPLGVPLTHGNFAHEVEAISKLGIARPSDVQLLFLPLAHIFARVLYLCSIGLGMRTVVEGDPQKLIQTCVETRPTFFAGVPHIFEILRRRIDSELEKSPLRGKVMGVLPAFVTSGSMNPIRAKFGGRLRFMISGGARLSPDTAEYFETLGIPLLEGYGLTEASGVATVNVPDERRIGSVGRPIPGTQVAIEEDGEILVRGPSCMHRYWGAAEEISVVDGQGWLRTGDLGFYDRDGFLFITGRKKDILVTSGGKNIAPSWIEAELKTKPSIDEAILVGDGLPFIGALLVPNWEYLESVLDRKISAEERNGPLPTRDVMSVVENDVRGVSQGLPPHERVKRFVFIPALDQALDYTPTLKLKRDRVVELHRAQIESLYRRER